MAQCSSNQFEATVVKHYTRYASQESFSIYQGVSAVGQPILSVQGATADNNSDKTFTACVSSGSYFITFGDTTGNGWGTTNKPAYVSIFLGGILIFKGGIPYQYGATDLTSGSATFQVSPVVSPVSQWKYTDAPQTSSNWAQSSFNDAGWTTVNNGNFPAFTSTTRYYRVTGTLTDRNTIPTIYFSLKTAYGFVYYLQGTEVYRYRMPSGNVLSSTPASSSAETAVSTSISANKFLLPTSGSFVIAFEVHLPAGTSGAADTFSSFAVLGEPRSEEEYGDNVFTDGTGTEDPEGYNMEYGVAFDESIYTHFYNAKNPAPSLIYTFNNGGAKWINYYALTSPNVINRGNPTAWTLYGSNDNGLTWDTLDIQSNILFEDVSITKYFTLRSNTKSYNKIKLTLQGSDHVTYVGVSRFMAYTRVFSQQIAGLAYDSDSFTGFAYSDAILLTPVVGGFNTFSSQPALPAGITLNPNSGVISGVPTEAASGTYTITAISTVNNQPSSVTITLQISGCDYPSKSLVRFKKINPTWYFQEESYTVTDSAGTVYNSPAFTSGSTQYFYYCFPPGNILVSLSDSYGDGWAIESSLSIQMSDGEGDFYTIATVTERKDLPDNFNYDVSYKIHPKSNLWTYSTNFVSNWYGAGAVSGFNTFDAANPPSSAGKSVWFFRTTVNMNPTGYDGFELRVKARAGYIVYVNGVEFIRKNLPAGDISSSTVPTSGEASSVYRFVSGPNSIFTAGSNVIAIGIANLAGNNPTTLLFDATLQQMKPNDIGRTFDISVSADPIGNNIGSISDTNLQSYWQTSLPLKGDITVTYTLGNHRAEHFNKHCVTSSTITDAYDPSDWAIYGSNDGTTFELLGNVTNAYFSARTTTRCFYMPNNKKAYSYYRMVVTETAVPTTSPYGLAIAELTFSMVDLDQLAVPTFSLDAPSYTGYVGVPFPEVTPSSDLFSDYSISPALQLPLEIDTSTGSIRGTPNVLMPPTLYTISAKTPKGQTVTTQVTLSVVNCEYPNNQFTILIQSGNAGEEMGFTLKDSTGNPIVTKSRFSNSQANYYPQCRATGSYTLSLTDSGGNGWDVGYFRVLLADESVVLFGSLGENEAAKDFKFYIGYLVTPLYASYQYLNSGAAAPADWNKPQSSVASTWQEAKPGAFGNFAGTTAYFRKTFTIDNINTFAALAFSVKTTYGVIVYINGERVYSYNMPKGNADYNTKCTTKLNQLMNVGSSVAIQYSNLVAGANVVCVEVHVADPTATNVIDFDSTIQLTADGSYRVLDGIASSDIANDESLGKLFDNVKGSVYATGPRCVGATPTWTYNNDRREFISSYTLITGPTCNVRTPSAWRIEGSNDGIHWSVLHETTREVFSRYSLERTYDFYNSKVYNKYRMSVTACANNGITSSLESSCSFGSGNGFQLAELGLYAKRLQAACEPTEDGFGGAVEGSYAYKDCAEFYQGRIQALCTGGQLTNIKELCLPMAIYNIDYGGDYISVEQGKEFSNQPVVYGVQFVCSISPELPSGVSFDPNTGRIYGKHSEIMAPVTYAVTCLNDAGSYTTNVSLGFTEKAGVAAWIWILLVVLILIIVTVTVLCILNRMKSKKNKAGHNKLSKANKSKNSAKKTGEVAKTVRI